MAVFLAVTIQPKTSRSFSHEKGVPETTKPKTKPVNANGRANIVWLNFTKLRYTFMV